MQNQKTKDILDSSDSEEGKYMASLEKQTNSNMNALRQTLELENEIKNIFKRRAQQEEAKTRITKSQIKLSNGHSVITFRHYQPKSAGPCTYQAIFHENPHKVQPKFSSSRVIPSYISQQQLSNPGPYGLDNSHSNQYYPKFEKTKVDNRIRPQQKYDYYKYQAYVNLQRKKNELGKNHIFGKDNRPWNKPPNSTHTGTPYYIEKYISEPREVIFPENARFQDQGEIQFLASLNEKNVL